MGAVSKLIEGIIHLAIVLAMMGLLKDATFFMAKEVARVHRKGLVSLTELNRGLMGEEKFCQVQRDLFGEPCKIRVKRKH